MEAQAQATQTVPDTSRSADAVLTTRGTKEITTPLGKFAVWEDTRVANKMRPIAYKPNGSFRELRNRGKLPDLTASEPQTRSATPESKETKTYPPGYTGYIRGRQHIKGQTYGNTVRLAQEMDYKDLAAGEAIPDPPQNTRHIDQYKLTHTFVGSHLSGKVYHLPGYTGYVPQQRFTFGRSYGALSGEQLTSPFSGSRSLEASIPNKATPLKSPHKTALSSDPLPGAPKSELAPVFLVPPTVKQLSYIAG